MDDGGHPVTHPAVAVLGGLVGRSLYRLVRYEDGPIGLLLTEPGDHTGAGGLSYLHVIAGAWRLVDGAEVLDGSYHQADPRRLGYAQRLEDRTIDGVSIESTADTDVALGSLHLIVWSGAAQEPILMWYRPDVEALIVSAGDVWSHAPLDDDDPLRHVAEVAIGSAHQ
jgi:hypothetical protein